MSQFHFQNSKPQRAEHFLKECLPMFSMQNLRDYLLNGALRLKSTMSGTEQILRKGTYLNLGDTVIWPNLPPLTSLPLADSAINLLIRHADEAILVIEKPAGIATYPLSPLEIGTLANGLVAKYPELAGIGKNPLEAGIVHRLDIGTSGLVIVAKSQALYNQCRKLFSSRKVVKEYLALVHGIITKPGEIKSPLAHNSKNREQMLVIRKAKPNQKVLSAHTSYQPISQHNNNTLLKVRIHTGVMHQIRAHLSYLGHPVVGEDIYTNHSMKSDNPPRYFLHAHRLEFTHPITHKLVSIESQLPNDLEKQLGQL